MTALSTFALTHFTSAKLAVRQQQSKGSYGLFARTFIPRDERLIVWGGDIFSYEQLKTLPATQQQYSVQVEEDLYLVTVKPPDAGDFINHSCDPNAGLQGQIVVVALRDIQPGEEVCYDYAMSDGSLYDEFDCGCGSPKCRRRITGNDWQLPDLQLRYKGYFSPYLQRRIERMQQEKAKMNQRFRWETWTRPRLLSPFATKR